MYRRIRVVFIIGAVAGAAAWSCSAGGPMIPDPSDVDGGAILPDGGMADGSVTAGLPLDSACAVLNAQRCAYLQRCGLIAPDMEAARDCELYFTATDCGPSRWPARAQEGTLRYSGVAAEACAAAWESHACSGFEVLPEPCRDIVSPNVLLGGSCFGGRANECREGQCTGGTCPRTCRLPGDANAICESTDDCRPGLYCQRTSSGGSAGVCTPYGTSGDPCDALRPCAKGFFCGTDFNICQPVRLIGQPCTTGTCEDSAFCGYGADGGICVARYGQGERCSDDLQCRPGLLCIQESGTCEPPGPLPQGAPCSRRQRCADGLACVGTWPDPFQPVQLGTCEVPSAEGEACTSSYDCAVPLACVFGPDGGTCAARSEDGAACRDDRDCTLFSRCISASCTRIPRPGEPCPGGTCLYGSCEAAGDGGVVCRGGLGHNAPCTRDEQCASLRCASGVCLAVCSP